MIDTPFTQTFSSRKTLGITLTGLLLLCTVACSSQENSTSSQPASESIEPEPKIEPVKTVEITLTLSDAAGFAEILKQQQGKVVLVDFWATWCIPCVKNFHHTVEWNEKFADQGLSVISVSMDESDQATQKAVLQFLEKQDAQFTNILATAAGDQDPMDTFGIDDGALPHYRIYDRSGKLIKKFFYSISGKEFTQADIEAAVAAELKSKPE